MSEIHPIEIEVPYAFEVANANVLDVLTELTSEEINRLSRAPDLTLVTHRIYVWQPWKLLGACGNIRLIKLSEQATRLRLIPPDFPTLPQCCETLFNQPGITEADGKRKVFERLYRQKYQSAPAAPYESFYVKEFELQTLLYLGQQCTELAQRQSQMFQTVVERLAQVLKFSLDAHRSAELSNSQQTQKEIEKPNLTPAQATQIAVLVEVNGVLLPDYATAKGSFNDYSPDTARRIMAGLPNAYKRFQLNGGRWGPRWVGEEVGINPTTISRYFKVFYEANILEFQGIPIPYAPRQAIKR